MRRTLLFLVIVLLPLLLGAKKCEGKPVQGDEAAVAEDTCASDAKAKSLPSFRIPTGFDTRPGDRWVLVATITGVCAGFEVEANVDGMTAHDYRKVTDPTTYSDRYIGFAVRVEIKPLNTADGRDGLEAGGIIHCALTNQRTGEVFTDRRDGPSRHGVTCAGASVRHM